MDKNTSDVKNQIRLMIGQRIREVRKQRDWTCEQLASRIGTTGGYIRQIESVRSPKLPSLDMFIDICAELRVSPNYLLQDVLKSGEPAGQTDLRTMWEDLPPAKQELVNTLIMSLTEQSN